MTRSEMKCNAKTRLGNGIFKNRWMIALLICVIMGAVTTAAGTVIPGLGALIIVGPVTYGMKKLFLTQAREDCDMKIGDLFCGFNEDFGGTFLLGLMSTLFITLWTFLLVIPGIVKTYAYDMIYYIKADHPEYDWRTCLKESQRMMKGHKWELFVLDLSFIGWFIVGSLCLGVGTLWVVPYTEATRAQFYMNLCGERIHEHQAAQPQTQWHDASQVDGGGQESTAEENKKSWDPER